MIIQRLHGIDCVSLPFFMFKKTDNFRYIWT